MNRKLERKIILSVKNLTVKFFTKNKIINAVNGISYDLYKGETLGIVGESGSGKSVNVLSITNLIRPPGKIIKGEIIYNSKDILNLNIKDLRKIRQMVEQNIVDAIDEIETASTTLKPHSPKQESIEDVVEDVVDEFEENDQEQSSTMTHFINATDVLDVQNNEGKELLLLNRAEKNLKPLLEYTGDELPKEAKLLIEKISQYSKELKDKFCR